MLAYQIAHYVFVVLDYFPYVLFIYILMSWFPGAYETGFGRFLSKICEPVLAPFRKIIPPIGGVLDLSPIIAFFAIRMATFGLQYLVYNYILPIVV
ncbi:YggT family protein [Listeria booriae]|uniref:YggT family protein n=1 Tax=Listeria booriae TaxID=1552123 RepID=UPI001624BBA6|nr:YggT family protein [Listeria booriae]MBC1976143.1 YggT family protein [Listeria booriae]MBC1984762.1 YggT family protein [Listeria booriae]MBC2023065.1 YggT family protein [Listeria booriae]MBC2033705.1 YggT family protein [Listeria booriae]MBC2047007.1 YggT family protein [Listeria booriae]